MSFPQDQVTRLDFCNRWVRTIESWRVGPGPLILTCEEFLGNTEEEIAKNASLFCLDPFALPEVAADEFETVFNWFQS